MGRINVYPPQWMIKYQKKNKTNLHKNAMSTEIAKNY